MGSLWFCRVSSPHLVSSSPAGAVELGHCRCALRLNLDSCWVTAGVWKGCRDAWPGAAWAGWPKPAQCWWVLSLQINAFISFVVALVSKHQPAAILPSLHTDVRKCLGMKICVLRACEQLTHCWESGAVGLLRSQNNSIKKPVWFWVGLLGATGLF